MFTGRVSPIGRQRRSAAARPLSAELTSNVIDVVRQRGYIYVEAASLDVSFTGINQQRTGVSWWIRCFDYL